MVLVFLCVACVVVCCVVHEVFFMCAACVVCCVVQHEVQLVKIFEYVVGISLSHRWFDGFETHFIRRVYYQKKGGGFKHMYLFRI